jgi:branched-chain amino acid transport system ATP-binding protein
MTAATLSSALDLHADNITIKFGGLVAVDDVSFTIPHGSVVSLIGPNGAGKTTYFNVLTGLYHPTSGRVYLGDEDVTGLSPHLVAHKGLARTFQNIRLFNLMTAEENVLVAMHSHMKAGIVETVLRSARRGSAPTSCCPSSTSAASVTSTPATFPTATSAASRWPGPWRSSPRCCCSTSPPPA